MRPLCIADPCQQLFVLPLQAPLHPPDHMNHEQGQDKQHDADFDAICWSLCGLLFARVVEE